jgi:hypothetical protein
VSTTIDFDPIDPELESHLRRTLTTLAATVDDIAPTVSTSMRPRRRRVRVGAIAGAAVIATASLGFVAWNVVEEGEIERIPGDAAILNGTADGYDWWLIPSTAIEGHTNPCGEPHPGVEVVSADANKPGLEWNTMGVTYGEPTAITRYTCAPDEYDFDRAAWLANPARADRGTTRLGDNNDPDSPWITALAVHPSVTAIEITIDDAEPFNVTTVSHPAQPDGPRYTAATAPPDACEITTTLLADGNPIPGSTNTTDVCP